MRRQEFVHVFVSERQTPGEQLEEDHTDGVDVASVIDGVAADHLGADVRRRSHRVNIPFSGEL